MNVTKCYRYQLLHFALTVLPLCGKKLSLSSYLDKPRTFVLFMATLHWIFQFKNNYHNDNRFLLYTESIHFTVWLLLDHLILLVYTREHTNQSGPVSYTHLDVYKRQDYTLSIAQHCKLEFTNSNTIQIYTSDKFNYIYKFYWVIFLIFARTHTHSIIYIQFN